MLRRSALTLEQERPVFKLIDRASRASLVLATTLLGCVKPATSPRKKSPAVYTNPVYAASMPDPSVIRHKGIYYAFGTTGAERTRDGRIFTVLGSRDLANWEKLGGALLPPSSDERVQYWAPEVTENGSMFALFLWGLCGPMASRGGTGLRIRLGSRLG